MYLSEKERERSRRASTVSDFVSLGAGGAAVKSAADGEQALVRWMAPECVRDAEYTHKSDVWAMGVVFYEIVSFARVPYGSMTAREITAEVAAGHRLEQPAACAEPLCACFFSFFHWGVL